MTGAVDYNELAKQQIADEADRQAQTAVEDRARHLQHTAERAAQLAKLATDHGLDPTAASPQEINRAVEEKRARFEKHVLSRTKYKGFAGALLADATDRLAGIPLGREHVRPHLSPDATDADVDRVLALRKQAEAEFEASEVGAAA
jgi:hypothetical protein